MINKSVIIKDNKIQMNNGEAISLTNLVPENIKSGVNIGGIIGTAPGPISSGYIDTVFPEYKLQANCASVGNNAFIFGGRTFTTTSTIVRTIYKFDMVRFIFAAEAGAIYDIRDVVDGEQIAKVSAIV